MKLHVQLVTVAVCELPDEQRQGSEGVAFELDAEIDDQDQPAQGTLVPLVVLRDEPQHDDQEQSEPGQTVFGDDAGIGAHGPYRVRGHGPVPTACENRLFAYVHELQHMPGEIGAGLRGRVDIARAEPGRQHPWLLDEPAQRAQRLVDTPHERVTTLGAVADDGA